MKNIRRNLGLAILLVLVIACSSCFMKEANADKAIEEAIVPIEVTENTGIEIVDIEGRRIVLEKTAERVVDCTGLGGTRILMQLGAEDCLVGTTDHCIKALIGDGPNSVVFHPTRYCASDLLEKGLESIGGYNEPNVQTIISLEPDVILVGWGGRELADSLYEQTGIPTICVGRMDGHFDYDLFEIIGKVVGAEERAEELIDYTNERLAEITTLSSKIPEEEQKSVYFWIYPALGKAPRSNGIYDAFGYAGVTNVAKSKDDIALYETSKEQIATWNPDYIFLQSFCKERMDGFYTNESLGEDPILQHIDAVKNERVFKLRGPCADWDTAVQLVEVFYVAKMVYPERFEHIDVEEYGNEILEKFYGVEKLYTDMRTYLDLSEL